MFGMHIDQIHLLSVPVSNQDRAKAFYVDTLGFQTIQDEVNTDTQTRFVVVAPHAAATGLTLVTWFPSMPAGSVRGLVLRTSDVDTDVERLRQTGVEVSDLADAPWGRFVTFSDPDGNGLILMGPRRAAA
jgi:catechol 2,3-dioxygenase-like lactoylglutathione lyase family enzyme